MPSAPKPLHIGPAATSETRRENSHRRGYDRQWNKISKRYLAAHPFCVHCAKAGRETLATEVDHIIPFRGNRDLKLDPENWQALCKVCHSKKTQAGL